MRFRKVRFPGIQGQVGLDYIRMTHRSVGALAFEIGTAQKYCEVLAYSGTEIHIIAGDSTPKDTYRANLPASTVMFPKFARGWDLTYATGRYTIRVALTMPNRGSRSSGVVFHDDDWRVQQIRGGR